ncbi:MAG: putative drug exporter of the superfamily [Pseudonocardiales bacterium]|nr:putative drug exporter of the superfamily [Pseudonocardiales bacterium]
MNATTGMTGPPSTQLQRTVFTRIGEFCTRHRRALLVGWLVFFVVGIVVGGQVFGHLKDSNGSSSSESVRGFNLVDDAVNHGADMVAVIDGAPVDDPATRTAVGAAADRVAKVKGVVDVETAYTSDEPQLRAVDGTASLMVISTVKTAEPEPSVIKQEVTDVRDVLKGSVPGATVKVGGELAVVYDGASTASSDLAKGELIVLPILLLALLLIFRGVRAALMPLAGALVTIAGALLLLRGITGFVNIAGYAVDVVVLFGLALSVDYSLLMVNRFREERGAGYDPHQAVVRTVNAAGRTITFSSLTVMAALAGLFAFGDPTFTSLAIGGIATALLALVAGLFLIPTLLTVWGAKIKPAAQAQADDGGFGRLARRVQRHPALVAGACAVGLVALAAPFLSVNYGNGDPRLLPASYESRAVADTLLDRFPGRQAEPIKVVAERTATDPAVVAYANRIRNFSGVQSVTIDTSLPGGLSSIDVIATGTTQGDTARDVVKTLRDNRPSYPTYVTGSAAFLIDFQHTITSRLPWALLLIAIATFVLLFLMTGSVLVPLKALVMNVLSLGATFGALVWIFQQGHLSGPLNFDAFGAIELWVPIVVFVFAFGLSMDYEVFLLSRIKECYEECGDSNRAVATGLQRSGRIITSAGILVVIVFAGFSLGSNLGIKEMGVALAVAVVIDVTIVRCLLVPATMTLLGDKNWWAPPPLRRLHNRFGLHEPASADLRERIPAQADSVDDVVHLAAPVVKS